MAANPMDSLDPDAALMVAFQKGDAAAFEQLLDKYGKAIVNFIYRIVNNAAEAEELGQEVFLRIFQARKTYEPRARFAAWIYRIATNVGLKALERSRRAPTWSPHDAGEDAARIHENLFKDGRPDPERVLAGSEMAGAVARAIRSLPHNERVAVVLRRYEELSYREIAEVMNCSEGAVKTYIHRGKLHLRERLLPYLKRGE